MASKPSMYTRITQKGVLYLEKLGGAGHKSSFQKSGKLTPDEFVRAGDFLVQNFPTWQWCGGLEDKRRAHLPADKQYLQTRDVPCLPPPGGGDGEESSEAAVADADEDGWVGLEGGSREEDDEASDEEDVAEIGSPSEPTGADGSGDVGAAEESDSDSAESLENFDYDESAVKDDDDATLASGAATGAEDEAVVSTRTYTVTVTYDTYYSTPRVWLFGFDADKEPLQGSAWQSDFSPEHVNKTVTYESHPHEGYSCPTIHPCKHAAAMLKMISLALSGEEGVIDVKYYLLIFLKFIQTIIPNIEYDYTSQFSLSSAGEK